jgi:hypothetical protein
MLQYEWRNVGSPAAFFADVTDAEIEEAARVLEATIFFLKIVSDHCEQIREELREKAQGQTSILEEDESLTTRGTTASLKRR